MKVNNIPVRNKYINARVRIRPHVNVRAKLSKWSKSPKIHFAYVLGHSQHLTKKNRAHADTRAFSVHSPLKRAKNTPIPHCLGVWCYLKHFLIVNSPTRTYAYVRASLRAHKFKILQIIWHSFCIRFWPFSLFSKSCAHADTRACARKNSKCSKSSEIHFAYVFGHSHYFQKSRAHADTRAFSVRQPYKGTKHCFSH